MPPGGLALVFSGGGARAAYQVGVLEAIAKRRPDLPIPILTGVSAGAINAAYLASHRGTLAQAVPTLREEWARLDSERVYGARLSLMARSAARWVVQAASGWRQGPPLARGLFDTGPLSEFLARGIDFSGIDANLTAGRLRAVALTATSYSTGTTTTFVHGVPGIPMWRRALRVSVPVRLTLDHVMASCAIPLVFPAVRLGEGFYGDGNVRQTSPLSPAIHLGADRLLAIASGPQVFQPSPRPARSEYPTAAEVFGLLLDAAFLDALDMDAERLYRTNLLLESLPPGTPAPDGLKPLELLVLRPSRELGMVAAEFRTQVPRAISMLLQALGAEGERGADFLSYLLFEPEHTRRLIELGRADTEAHLPGIERFLGA